MNPIIALLLLAAALCAAPAAAHPGSDSYSTDSTAEPAGPRNALAITGEATGDFNLSHGTLVYRRWLTERLGLGVSVSPRSYRAARAGDIPALREDLGPLATWRLTEHISLTAASCAAAASAASSTRSARATGATSGSSPAACRWTWCCPCCPSTASPAT